MSDAEDGSTQRQRGTKRGRGGSQGPDNLPSHVSKQQRLDMRRTYRAAEKELEANIDTYAQPGNQSVLGILNKADAKFATVTHVHELVDDVRVNALAASIVARQAENLLSLQSSVSWSDLRDTLKRSYEGARGFDWVKLGTDAAVFDHSVPVCVFMRGPVHVEPVVRTRPQRAPKAPVEHHPQVKLNEIDDEDETVDGHNTKRVHMLEQALRALNEACAGRNIIRRADGTQVYRMPFYTTLIDPQSYSKTVENLFYTAFAVKDGTIIIDLDNDLPFLGIRNRDAKGTIDEEVKKVPPVQSILSLDMAQWRDIVDAFNITKSALPDFNAYRDCADLAKRWVPSAVELN